MKKIKVKKFWINRKIMTFVILLVTTSTSVTSANAEVVNFPCTGGTYSVEMPAATITKSNGCFGDLIIDSSVKSIGNRAFFLSYITSVSIPDSVTSIGDSAFAGSKSTSVIIPNSVTSIGAQAFHASNIFSVAISSSLKEITGSSFSFTHYLTSVDIPVGVQTIGQYAFSHSKVSTVTIPSTVTAIGVGAFSWTKLTEVDIPDSVKTIGRFAFDEVITSITYCGAKGDLPIAPTCPADRKAILDAAAKATAKAAANKKTITCVKGKLVKKVTAVKPKCPSGYRAK
jgi:hypothetical protein